MNKEKIYFKLDFISKYLKELETLTKKEKDFVIKEAMERMAEKIIESAIKINNIILQEKNIMPKSYFDSFKELKCINIFEEEYLLKIANTAGFRNRLAHEYEDLDEKIVENTYKTIIEVYKIYIKEIIKYVK